MKGDQKVPWAKVHDYLLRVEACTTAGDFMLTACREMETLIPFDAAAAVFSAVDGSYLAGVGVPAAAAAAYNGYYRMRQPVCPPGQSMPNGRWERVFGPVIDWRRHEGLEFAVDFMMRNGWVKSLQRDFPGRRITLAIQRSRRSRGFTEAEARTLAVLGGHLVNLFTFLSGRRDQPDTALSADGIAERFRVLSHREAELCALLARRMSTWEMASVLFVSPRTVEKHIENVFEKLAVCSREQVRNLLGAQSPAAAMR
jgi:DNA-binding CsgD family transcriptional regulator